MLNPMDPCSANTGWVGTGWIAEWTGGAEAVGRRSGGRSVISCLVAGFSALNNTCCICISTTDLILVGSFFTLSAQTSKRTCTGSLSAAFLSFSSRSCLCSASLFLCSSLICLSNSSCGSCAGASLLFTPFWAAL